MIKKLFLAILLTAGLAACSSSQTPSSSQAVQAPATSSTTVATAPAAVSTARSTPTPVRRTGSTAATVSTAAAATPVSTAAAPAKSAATTGVPVTAPADSGRWVQGKNYFLIQPSQPTAHPGKVVVTEVFSWACPACNRFAPFADSIRRSLPKYAVWNYLPAGFIPTEDWPVFQRAYYAAVAMGVDTPKIHDAMFNAIWTTGELATYNPRTRRELKPGIKDIAKFYAKYGVNAAAFVATAKSFAVRARVRRADQLIKLLGVTATPTMVVNGKYRFTVGDAGGYQQTGELVRWLAQREAAAMHLQQ